jgi:hypothetical protein
MTNPRSLSPPMNEHFSIFIRELSGQERGLVMRIGLRAARALTMRRAQILLLSVAGRWPAA